MKSLSTLCISIALSVVSLSAAAHGNVTCDSLPKTDWKKQMELQEKLTNEGWKVRQVKTENNCYEVYGFDEKGNRVEAFFHPKTFERVDAPSAKPTAK